MRETEAKYDTRQLRSYLAGESGLEGSSTFDDETFRVVLKPHSELTRLNGGYASPTVMVDQPVGPCVSNEHMVDTDQGRSKMCCYRVSLFQLS